MCQMNNIEFSANQKNEAILTQFRNAFHIFRLVCALEISLSVKSIIKDSITQAIENVDVEMQAADCQDRIKRYQQELTEHALGNDFLLDLVLIFGNYLILILMVFFNISLGCTWVIAFKKVKQLDEVILEAKQNARSAKDELESAIEVHENKAKKLKDDIRRLN